MLIERINKGLCCWDRQCSLHIAWLADEGIILQCALPSFAFIVYCSDSYLRMLMLALHILILALVVGSAIANVLIARRGDHCRMQSTSRLFVALVTSVVLVIVFIDCHISHHHMDLRHICRVLRFSAPYYYLSKSLLIRALILALGYTPLPLQTRANVRDRRLKMPKSHRFLFALAARSTSSYCSLYTLAASR